MTFILNSVPYIFVDTGPLTSDIATSEKIELVLIVSKSVSAARLPESLNTPSYVNGSPSIKVPFIFIHLPVGALLYVI